MIKIKIEIPESIAETLEHLITMHFDFHKGMNQTVFFNASLLRAKKKLTHFLYRKKQSGFRSTKPKTKVICKITLLIDELCAIYEFIKIRDLYSVTQEFRLFYGVLNKEIVDLDTNRAYSTT